jgi:hypothetical protein
MTKNNFKTTLLISLTLISLLLSQSIFSQETWFKVGNAPKQYENFIDSSNQRDGKNVMTLKSIDTNINGFGSLMQNMKPDKYLGKKVKMTGYLKSKDVTNWAGFWLRVDQAGSQQSLSFDNMHDRPIIGTTNWKKYEIVLDVPKEASNIAFGALLIETGQIWLDNVNFEVVDNSVPTTGQEK